MGSTKHLVPDPVPAWIQGPIPIGSGINEQTAEEEADDRTIFHKKVPNPLVAILKSGEHQMRPKR